MASQSIRMNHYCSEHVDMSVAFGYKYVSFGDEGYGGMEEGRMIQ